MNMKASSTAPARLGTALSRLGQKLPDVLVWDDASAQFLGRWRIQAAVAGPDGEYYKAAKYSPFEPVEIETVKEAALTVLAEEGVNDPATMERLISLLKNQTTAKQPKPATPIADFKRAVIPFERDNKAIPLPTEANVKLAFQCLKISPRLVRSASLRFRYQLFNRLSESFDLFVPWPMFERVFASLGN